MINIAFYKIEKVKASFMKYRMRESSYGTVQVVITITFYKLMVNIQYGSEYINEPYVSWEVVK